MRKLSKFLGLCCLWHGFVFAEVKIQVIDSNGQPVPNAVVSVPLSGADISINPTNLDQSSLEPVVMDQIDKQFLPRVLVVNAWQPVIFPNSDQVRHHVYSFSKPNDFEIRLYSGNQLEPLRFEHPGVVVLGCNIHDDMVGYLYVEQNELAHVSDSNGVVVFDDKYLNNSLPEQRVTVWHSQLSSSKTERVTSLLSDKNDKDGWLVKLNLIPEAKKSSRKFKLRY